jgi:hypothetical protein
MSETWKAVEILKRHQREMISLIKVSMSETRKAGEILKRHQREMVFVDQGVHV